MYDRVWVTRDGRMIPVSKMETSHIRNCIAKIRCSRSNWRHEYLERLKLELLIRSMGDRT